MRSMPGKGGLLETDAKSAKLGPLFRRMSHTLGNYKSYEVIETINSANPAKSSIYRLILSRRRLCAIMFTGRQGLGGAKHGFSARPGTIMPWLAFTGEIRPIIALVRRRFADRQLANFC